MKEQKWFTCHDCGKVRGGDPILVMRSIHSRDVMGYVRVKVCSHCEHGTVPTKQGKK